MVFVSNRREDNHHGGGFTVVALFQHSIDHGCQILFQGWEVIRPLECFVISEETEYDISLNLGKPLISRTKVVGTRSYVDFIAGESQVSERDFVFRVDRLNIRLQPTLMLHPIGQIISDDSDSCCLR